MIDTEDLRLQIIELYDECVENTNQFHRKLDLFQIPDTLAIIISKATGINIEGYWISIDNFGILHTLEHHGNPISEAKRGQLYVEKQDFITMLDVCLNPDVVKYFEAKNGTQKFLQFEKEIDNKIYVVKEIRTITSINKNKINRLMFHTMYKIKATNKN